MPLARSDGRCEVPHLSICRVRNAANPVPCRGGTMAVRTAYQVDIPVRGARVRTAAAGTCSERACTRSAATPNMEVLNLAKANMNDTETYGQRHWEGAQRRHVLSRNCIEPDRRRAMAIFQRILRVVSVCGVPVRDCRHCLLAAVHTRAACGKSARTFTSQSSRLHRPARRFPQGLFGCAVPDRHTSSTHLRAA